MRLDGLAGGAGLIHHLHAGANEELTTSLAHVGINRHGRIARFLSASDQSRRGRAAQQHAMVKAEHVSLSLSLSLSGKGGYCEGGCENKTKHGWML